MKNFKLLIMSFVVVSLFLSTADVNAQGNSTKDVVPFSFYCPCANNGAGEMLEGMLMFHIVSNKNIEHANIIGSVLVGQSSGDIYHFSRTEKFNKRTGELVLNVRTTGPNGLTTYFQIVGEAYIGIGDDWVAGPTAKVSFYCR